jgi:hypothetical protein
MRYLELFLEIAFCLVVIGTCSTLLFAVVANLTGWWDKPNKE